MSQCFKCASCKLNFDPESIITTCVCCLKIFHAAQECSFVSSSEYNVLKLKTIEPLLMYRCIDCKKRGGISASLFESLSCLKDLGDKLDNSCNKMDQMHQDFINCLNDVKTIKIDVKNLQAKYSSLETQLNQKIDNQTFSIDDINAEIQDRLDRSCNLIVYGVDVNDQTTSDANKIRSILHCINNLDLSKISTKRLGKVTNGKSPPTLVKLSCKNDVHRILRQKKRLPNGISVSTDKTELQRKGLSTLLKSVEANNCTSNIKQTIKYIRGVPTIVNVEPSDSS